MTDTAARDIAEAIRTGDEGELTDIHRTDSERGMWEDVAAKHRANGNVEATAVSERRLAELPAVTPLQGLQATARLVRLLVGRQWIGIMRAREQGASWAEVGLALDVTEDEARAMYEEAIADQERWCSKHHDTARARAVLDGKG